MPGCATRRRRSRSTARFYERVRPRRRSRASSQRGAVRGATTASRGARARGLSTLGEFTSANNVPASARRRGRGSTRPNDASRAAAEGRPGRLGDRRGAFGRRRLGERAQPRAAASSREASRRWRRRPRDRPSDVSARKRQDGRRSRTRAVPRGSTSLASTRPVVALGHVVAAAADRRAGPNVDRARRRRRRRARRAQARGARRGASSEAERWRRAERSMGTATRAPLTPGVACARRARPTLVPRRAVARPVADRAFRLGDAAPLAPMNHSPTSAHVAMRAPRDGRLRRPLPRRPLTQTRIHLPPADPAARGGDARRRGARRRHWPALMPRPRSRTPLVGVVFRKRPARQIARAARRNLGL